MKKKTQTAIALTLSAVLLGSCLAGCAKKEEDDAAKPVQSDAAVSQAQALLTSHGTEEGKEETVYVITNASGQAQKTIVSGWLKNPEEKAELTDTADLEDLENVKGEEGYTDNGDGTVTWQANGSDIYYQGNSSQQLPITTDIAYTLDGKTVTPEELAGASGHLTMTFTYQNHTAAMRMVKGEEVTLYQPFVVVSGVMLDNDKVSDVTVTNGKIINTGDQTVVVGLALPGWEESLGLTDMTDQDGKPLDLDIPQSVEITAEVTDFSLLTAITIMGNSLFNDMDLDSVDNLDDLESALQDLTSASAQLVEGTTALRDGIETLSDGASQLSAGANQLDAGIGTLQSKASALPSGVSSLTSGATKIRTALTEDMTNGVSSLSSGAATMAEKLKSNDAENPGIYEGAAGIYAGAGQIGQAASQVQQGLEALPDKLAQAKGGLDGASQCTQGAEGLLQALAADESLTQEQRDSVNSALSLLANADGAISATAAGLDGVSLDEANTALSGIIAGSQSIQSGANSIMTGAESLQQGAYQLVGGTDALQEGIDTMVSGNNGNNLNAMVAGLQQMQQSGATLVAGVNELKNGSAKLSGGADDLVSGVDQLLAGAQELMDGMTQFDREGIQKLSDLWEGDFDQLLQRLRALQAYGKEYTSFAGQGQSDMPSTVKFICRSQSIGE